MQALDIIPSVKRWMHRSIRQQKKDTICSDGPEAIGVQYSSDEFCAISQLNGN
jgi:hypothetical protein